MYKDTGWFLARLFVFLVLNFGALFSGGYISANEINSDWYLSLEKPGWMPADYIFGIVWFIVMMTFSFFMAGMYRIFSPSGRIIFIVIYVLQLMLNISWNPLFFYSQRPDLALIDIVMLFAVVTYFCIISLRKRKTFYFLLSLPYFLWLMLLVSLNAYIVYNNSFYVSSG